MSAATDRAFGSGYQAALADIAQKFVEEGSDGVADWILNNLHGEQYLKDQVKIEKEVK